MNKAIVATLILLAGSSSAAMAQAGADTHSGNAASTAKPADTGMTSGAAMPTARESGAAAPTTGTMSNTAPTNVPTAPTSGTR